MCQGEKAHQQYLKNLRGLGEKRSIEEIAEKNGWIKVYDRTEKEKDNKKVKKERSRFMRRSI